MSAAAGDSVRARGLVLVSGSVEKLKRTKGEENFVLTDTDRTGFGFVAIAAGLVGLGGQAVATAAVAGDTSESAHFLELVVDGTEVAGWVWRSPFKVGDNVQIAAYWDGHNFILQGAWRTSDGMVALYPHCSRGRRAHSRNAWKWGGFFIAAMVAAYFVLATVALVYARPPSEKLFEAATTVYGIGLVSLIVFFALMTFSLARKWMPYVYAAESVFRTFGWKDPERIDLVKSSKLLRKGDEPAEYGTFYFRYKPDA
jgi:hypothetical protein